MTKAVLEAESEAKCDDELAARAEQFRELAGVVKWRGSIA